MEVCGRKELRRCRRQCCQRLLGEAAVVWEIHDAGQWHDLVSDRKRRSCWHALISDWDPCWGAGERQEGKWKVRGRLSSMKRALNCCCGNVCSCFVKSLQAGKCCPQKAKKVCGFEMENQKPMGLGEENGARSSAVTAPKRAWFQSGKNQMFWAFLCSKKRGRLCRGKRDKVSKRAMIVTFEGFNLVGELLDNFGGGIARPNCTNHGEKVGKEGKALKGGGCGAAETLAGNPHRAHEIGEPIWFSSPAMQAQSQSWEETRRSSRDSLLHGAAMGMSDWKGPGELRFDIGGSKVISWCS